MDLTPKQHDLIETVRTRRQLGELLTIEELSDFLAVSIRTIQRMHANGEGPPRCRRSNRLVYPIADLLRWLGRKNVDDKSRGEKLAGTISESALQKRLGPGLDWGPRPKSGSKSMP